MNNVTYPHSSGRIAFRSTAARVVNKLVQACGLQCVFVVLMWLGLSQVAMAAQTPAGTRISAQASATYQMEGMVHPLTVWSSVVVANVSPVEALTLTGPTSLSTPPGGTVLVNYLLTNSGNTASRYKFELDTSGCGGSNVVVSQLRLALDADRNGAVEAQETIATGSVAASLLPGHSASLLVKGMAPSLSVVACVKLTATTEAQEVTAALQTTVQVGAGASVSLSKTVVSNGALIRGSSLLDFTVTATNTGNDDASPTGEVGPAATPTSVKINGVSASRVLLRDELPAGTQYVMGSLSSSHAGDRLFRLEGDPPFSYRTNEDAAAIEVAVGLPNALVPQSAASMSFRAKLRPAADGKFPPDIVNVGHVEFKNGSAPVSARSNAVVLPVSDNRLGVALQAVSTVPQTDATGVADGTAIVTFRARLRNYGAAPLYNPQLHHPIEGGGSSFFFGSWTAALPLTGQYAVVPGSLRLVASAPSNAVAPLSITFTGRNGNDNLLAPGGVLPVGGDITVEYAIRVNFLGRTGDVSTTASASAASSASSASDVGDDGSSDGTDPDPAGDGMPQLQASLTRVSIPPLLSVVHTTGAPRRLGNGAFEIDHTVKVTNNGAVSAAGVRVFNNLECAISRNDNLPDTTPSRNVAVAVHKKLSEHVAVEAGVRDGNAASTRAGSFDYGSAPGTGTPGLGGMAAAPGNLASASARPDAVDTTTARVRITARPPSLPSAEVFGEVEQDLHDSDRRLVAAGGSYALGANVRVYGRREFNSGLYDNGVDTNRITSLVGIDGAYMEGGRVFNEYRVGTRGASNGIGLRNTFAFSEHLQFSGSAEHAKQLSGTGDDATAIALGVEYSNGPWRGSSAMEWREAGDASSWLFNLGGAYRLDNDWSVLARSVLTQTGDDKAGTRRLSRVQVGLAWRPAYTDVVNGLLRYEHRQESITAGNTGGSAYSLYGSSGAALPGDYDTHLVAGVINVNPRRGEVITGRYAARINSVADDISTSRTFTQLLHARYTRDLTPDWDLGAQIGLLRSRGGARQSLLGLELGYQVTPGLWLSGGYNWRGLRDDELAGSNYTHRGWYMRLRFKFDETTLGLGGGASVKTAPAARVDAAPSTTAPPSPPSSPVSAAEPDGLTDPLASRLQWSEASLFQGNGTELLPGGRARLEHLGALLKQANASRLELSMGHGDDPARVDSVWLPRATAVRRLLAKTCDCAVGMGLDTQPVPFATTPSSSSPSVSDAAVDFALYVHAVASTDSIAAAR